MCPVAKLAGTREPGRSWPFRGLKEGSNARLTKKLEQLFSKTTRMGAYDKSLNRLGE